MLVDVPCPDCGPVDIELSRATLVSRQADSTSWLAVPCPRCGHRFVRDVTAADSLMLAAMDIATIETDHPRERLDADVDTEPLTYEELVRFSDALTEIDQLTRLIDQP